MQADTIMGITIIVYTSYKLYGRKLYVDMIVLSIQVQLHKA